MNPSSTACLSLAIRTKARGATCGADKPRATNHGAPSGEPTISLVERKLAARGRLKQALNPVPMFQCLQRLALCRPLLPGIVILATSTTADDKGAAPPPPPLAEYQGRVIAQTMHWSAAGWLIRHKREREEASTLMREKLALKPGMAVCDMGCGNGYHTLPMAQQVGPQGKVYAVDVQPEMIDLLKQRLQKHDQTNIVPVVGLYHDPRLPEGSCDLILCVDVYHEFSHPAHMLAAMRKALKPGGCVVLVEFRSEDDSVPIKPEHKMSREQIMKELTSNGFALAREFDGLPWQHMMWFEAADRAGKSNPGTDLTKP